jgi:hypothetical protein
MVGANHIILDQIVRFFILLSDAPSYWFSLTTIQPRWSTMNTTIHGMMGAIASGGGKWLLTAVLAYGGKAAVVKMVSSSGSGG